MTAQAILPPPPAQVLDAFEPWETPDANLIGAQFRFKYPELLRPLNGRIEKTIRMVSLPNIVHRTDRTNIFWVHSSSNHQPGAGYEVNTTEKTCQCPDAGKGNLCWHRLAVGFFLHGQAWLNELCHDTGRLNTSIPEYRQLLDDLADLHLAEERAWSRADAAIEQYISLAESDYAAAQELKPAMFAAMEAAENTADAVAAKIDQIKSIIRQ